MVAVAAAHTTTTLAQALTGQGRSSSCKIWEVYTQMQDFLHFRTHFHLGFRRLRDAKTARRRPHSFPWEKGSALVRGGAHVNFLVAHLNVVRHADLPLEPVERHDQIAAYGRVIARLNEIRRLSVLLLQRGAGFLHHAAERHEPATLQDCCQKLDPLVRAAGVCFIDPLAGLHRVLAHLGHSVRTLALNRVNLDRWVVVGAKRPAPFGHPAVMVDVVGTSRVEVALTHQHDCVNVRMPLARLLVVSDF
ncbi:Uncharacterised protein [Chlamydia trachomatis]|nr:Uncharacterised protein [Chlamydia trachomatis]